MQPPRPSLLQRFPPVALLGVVLGIPLALWFAFNPEALAITAASCAVAVVLTALEWIGGQLMPPPRRRPLSAAWAPAGLQPRRWDPDVIDVAREPWAELHRSPPQLVEHKRGCTHRQPLDPRALRVAPHEGGWCVFSGALRISPRRLDEPDAQRDLKWLRSFFACDVRAATCAPRRAPTREDALRCPYCRDALERASAVGCPACGTQLHGECAAEHPACTTVGCGGRLAA